MKGVILRVIRGLTRDMRGLSRVISRSKLGREAQ